MSLLRNLDTGMRRLGFLDVLMSSIEYPWGIIETNEVFRRFWDKVSANQIKWLEGLARERKIWTSRKRSEVGRLSHDTAKRYFKFARELGLIVYWEEKRGDRFSLTNAGKLMWLNSTDDKHIFHIQHNPKQLILLGKIFGEKDWILSKKILEYIRHRGPLKKIDIFKWAKEKCLPEVRDDFFEELDRDFVESRLLHIIRAERVRDVYDDLKHIFDTRLEHLVDLLALEKVAGPIYKSGENTKYYLLMLDRLGAGDLDGFFNASAGMLNWHRSAPSDNLPETLVQAYRKLVNPEDPFYLVDIDTLIFSASVIASASHQAPVVPSLVREVFENIRQEYSEGINLYKNVDGSVSVSISREVQENLGRAK